MIGAGPSIWRIDDTSKGEQTIALAPESIASFANPRALSTALLAKPISIRSDWAKEVRMVTAVMWVCGAAATAALIIALPPAACTVRNFGAKSATAFVAPLTVCGMSWSLRSKKISESVTSLIALTPSAPKVRKNSKPNLKTETQS